MENKIIRKRVLSGTVRVDPDPKVIESGIRECFKDFQSKSGIIWETLNIEVEEEDYFTLFGKPGRYLHISVEQVYEEE